MKLHVPILAFLIISQCAFISAQVESSIHVTSSSSLSTNILTVEFEELSFISEIEKRLFKEFNTTDSLSVTKHIVPLLIASSENAKPSDIEDHLSVIQTFCKLLDSSKVAKGNSSTNIFIRDRIKAKFLRGYSFNSNYLLMITTGGFKHYTAAALTASVLETLGIPFLVSNGIERLTVTAYPGSKKEFEIAYQKQFESNSYSRWEVIDLNITYDLIDAFESHILIKRLITREEIINQELETRRKRLIGYLNPSPKDLVYIQYLSEGLDYYTSKENSLALQYLEKAHFIKPSPLTEKLLCSAYRNSLVKRATYNVADLMRAIRIYKCDSDKLDVAVVEAISSQAFSDAIKKGYSQNRPKLDSICQTISVAIEDIEAVKRINHSYNLLLFDAAYNRNLLMDQLLAYCKIAAYLPNHEQSVQIGKVLLSKLSHDFQGNLLASYLDSSATLAGIDNRLLSLSQNSASETRTVSLNLLWAVRQAVAMAALKKGRYHIVEDYLAKVEGERPFDTVSPIENGSINFFAQSFLQYAIAIRETNKAKAIELLAKAKSLWPEDSEIKEHLEFIR